MKMRTTFSSPRCRLHRQQLCFWTGLRALAPRWSISICSRMRQCGKPGIAEGNAAHSLVKGDICDGELTGCAPAGTPSAGGGAFCRGEPRGPVDCGPGRLRSHERHRDLTLLQQAKGTGLSWIRRTGRTSGFCTFQPMRFTDAGSGPIRRFPRQRRTRRTVLMQLPRRLGHLVRAYHTPSVCRC